MKNAPGVKLRFVLVAEVDSDLLAHLDSRTRTGVKKGGLHNFAVCNKLMTALTNESAVVAYTALPEEG